MAAGRLDLCVEQGADFACNFTLTDSTGNTLDLTGSTFTGQIRSNYSSPTIIASFQFAIGDQTQTATKGFVAMTLTNEVTTGIPVTASTSYNRSPTIYTYDVFRTFANGSKARVIEGLVKVSPEVTQ
jgi:hypothetical protein